MAPRPIASDMKAVPICIRAGVLLAVVFAVAACGGASKTAAQPPGDATTADVSGKDGAGAAEAGGAEGDASAGSDESQDPEAAFDRSERELAELFDRGSIGPGRASGARPESPQVASDDDGEEVSAVQQKSRCTVACRALSSMVRSAQRVCNMTGEDDPRCASLRVRIKRAKSVVYARCPACLAARR